MMKKNFWLRCLTLGLGAALMVVCGGCSQEEAAQTLKEAEQSAEETAGTIAKDVGEVVKKGEEMASELGEKAMAYLSPLKDKFGDLESLKQSPEELKKAVTELIQSIEEKAEAIQLPEAVSNTLASVKEKLIALKDYLEGEVEQAKIDEHLQDIMETVKSGLGMSKE